MLFLSSAFPQLVQTAQFAICAVNTDGTKALCQTQNTRSCCLRDSKKKLRYFVANLKLDQLRIILSFIRAEKGLVLIYTLFATLPLFVSRHISCHDFSRGEYLSKKSESVWHVFWDILELSGMLTQQILKLTA